MKDEYNMYGSHTLRPILYEYIKFNYINVHLEAKNCECVNKVIHGRT